MSLIQQDVAIYLEHRLCELYGFDLRDKKPGLLTSDNFRYNPLDAAKLLVSYIYANKLETNQNKFDSLLSDYEYIFSHPDDCDMGKELSNYLDIIDGLIDDYTQT